MILWILVLPVFVVAIYVGIYLLTDEVVSRKGKYK